MNPSRAERGVSFPEPESWANIVRDRKLTDAQANTLKITLKEALDDIDRYQKRPSRDVLVKHLKLFEEALKRLQDECQRSAKLMEFFLPSDTLDFIGESLTFSAMSEALGRDVFPKNYDFQIQVKQSQGKRITLASVEQDTRPRRRALGLKHGHLILTYLIERIHGPLERWMELDRLNKGRSKAGCREEISNLSPRRSGPCSPWQSCLSLHHGEVRRSVFRCPGRMWPARKWDRKGYSGCGQATACQPSEMMHWTRTMIARAFDPKPGDIPLIFWVRIKACDAVSAKAWPTRVRPTNNRPCDYARLRARSKFPRGARMDRARIARAHRLRSKAIFPAIWSSGIRSSMPSFSAWWRLGRRSLGHRTRIMRGRQAGLP
jgi:hypothetical protein